MCVVGYIVIVVVYVDYVVVIVFDFGEVDYVVGYGYYWIVDVGVEIYVFVGGCIVIEWIVVGIEIGGDVGVVDWYVIWNGVLFELVVEYQ